MGPRSSPESRGRPGSAVAITVAALGLAVGCSEDAPEPRGAAGPATASTAEGDPALFDYAQRRRVPVAVSSTSMVGPVRVQEISYPSPRGGQVTATTATPGRGGTDVGVILLHGMPLDRDDMREPAVAYACAGATSLAIDAPYVRAGKGAIKLTPRDRTEQVQHIVDLRRGIDVLAHRGATHVSLVGLSHGASMGALLAGVDDRVDSAALLVGDGGLVAHLTDEGGDPEGELGTVSPQQADAWLEAMRPVEPLLYVGDSDADLLFLNGRHDTLVEPADAEQLHEAAGADAEVRWYDTGHDLSAEAIRHHFEWVGEHAGLDLDRLDACVDAHAPLS